MDVRLSATNTLKLVTIGTTNLTELSHERQIKIFHNFVNPFYRFLGDFI